MGGSKRVGDFRADELGEGEVVVDLVARAVELGEGSFI